jgi:hypothetical protein
LDERTKALSQAGIQAEFLSTTSLHVLESALSVGKDGSAMFLPQDCQIDAFQAVSLIEKVCPTEFQFSSVIFAALCIISLIIHCYHFLMKDQ